MWERCMPVTIVQQGGIMTRHADSDNDGQGDTCDRDVDNDGKM